MLSPTQEEIVNTPGNMIVRASAGTGKTHTMVSKIVKEIKDNHSHKVVAAITFTIKAANEIRERLTIDPDRHFLGTNNNFVIEEIIRPFMRDVFGKEYNKDFSTDYSVKVKSYQDGMELIKNQALLVSYENGKHNFIFELAYNILSNSKACQEYLKAKYFKIYIDEYQDCDVDMHKLFMYICDNLHIDTFVVGDEKQSIYIWRGAYPQAFLSILNKPNFIEKFMGDNFRSCVQIQNYSNLLCQETKHLYNRIDDLGNVIIVNVQNGIDWTEKVVELLDSTKRLAVLRYSKNNASKAAEDMNKRGLDFVYVPQTPIDDITTNTAWLYSAIAKYFIIPTYSVYDVMLIVPEEAVGNKKIKFFLEKSIAELEECIIRNDYELFESKVVGLASYFGYEARTEHVNKLFCTIVDKQYHAAFQMDLLKKVAITFHSSKGLEFDQVVIFANDYRLNDSESIYNHYVAATRAKSKLIIVNNEGDYNASCYYKNIQKIFEQSALSVPEVVTIV